MGTGAGREGIFALDCRAQVSAAIDGSRAVS
jgi:hypothetical protein